MVTNTNIGLTQVQEEVKGILDSAESLKNVNLAMLRNMVSAYYEGDKADIEARVALIDPVDDAKLKDLLASLMLILEEAQPGSTAAIQAIQAEGEAKLLE